MLIMFRNLTVLMTLTVVCLMFAPVRRITTGDPFLGADTGSNAPILPLPSPGRSFEELCREDPLTALQGELAKHRAKVEGYQCLFVKRERIGGKLRPREVIDCDFQESPFAVRMKWLEGKGKAEAMLYVSGENDNQLLVIPANSVAKNALKLLGKHYANRSPDGSEARDAARLPVTEFGLEHALRRTLNAWQLARERGDLDVKYVGIREIPELDGQKCHEFHRVCKTPEEDGLIRVTMFVDVANRQQVGIILHGEKDLIGEYFFKKIRLNPPFANDHFAARHFK